MNMNDAVKKYTKLLNDVAALAKYNLDCDAARDAARDDAVFDQLHGDKEKRPTQAAEDNEPPMPRVDMNIELALLCASVGGERDPFEEDWSDLSYALNRSNCTDQTLDSIERLHKEFVAACLSGDWREVEMCAKDLTFYLREAVNAAEQKDADHKLIKEMHEAVMYLSDAMKRESKKARKTGKANHRKGTK